MSKAHLVGTKRDRINRIKLARVDDERRKNLVSRARELIHQKNFATNSAGIERMLKPQSLVPTSVRFLVFLNGD
jgi:hypothetical protein